MIEAPIAGVVLAGGQATRMGGGDKALLEISGRPILAIILERLGTDVGPLAINANGDPARFAAFALPVVADADNSRPGPLGGVLAGLRWAERLEPRPQRLLTVAGDTPFLPRGLAARFSAASGTDRIAVAASGGRRQPTIALWPIALSGALAEFLREGKSFKVTDFIDRHPNVTVDFPATGAIDPFFNVNTPDDLETARRMARTIP